MRKIYLFAMALAVLMSLTSCGKSKVNKIINEANLMTVNEDFDNALALCDELYENKLEKLSLEHKCDLSIVYRDIYSKTKKVDVLNKCIDVYKSALSDNAKRVKSYIVETHDEFAYEDFENLMKKQLNIAINQCLKKIDARLEKDAMDKVFNSCDSIYERRYSEMNFNQKCKMCCLFYDISKNSEGEISDNAYSKSARIYGDVSYDIDALSKYLFNRYGFGSFDVTFELSVTSEAMKSGLF